jgi:PAS domain-containing protein
MEFEGPGRSEPGMPVRSIRSDRLLRGAIAYFGLCPDYPPQAGRVAQVERARDDLRESEQRFRAVVDQAVDGFFLFDWTLAFWT